VQRTTMLTMLTRTGQIIWQS